MSKLQLCSEPFITFMTICIEAFVLDICSKRCKRRIYFQHSLPTHMLLDFSHQRSWIKIFLQAQRILVRNGYCSVSRLSQVVVCLWTRCNQNLRMEEKLTCCEPRSAILRTLIVFVRQQTSPACVCRNAVFKGGNSVWILKFLKFCDWTVD